MHVFTEEEMRSIEADGAKRFDGRTMLVELPEFDISVVVAPFDRPGYAEHADNEERDQQTAYAAAVMSRLLWPDFATVERYRQSCAMFSQHVSLELDQEAGLGTTLASVRPLDATKPPAGLNSADASRMLTEAKAKLWALEDLSQDLSCVMACPPTNVWIAARTLFDDAKRKRSGIIASMEPWLLGAVVWAREPLTVEGGRGLLDRKPGLFWALRRAYLRMGGDGATVRRKSLRDAAPVTAAGS